MNKKLSMLLPVIATCGLLAGCGTDYYTKDSTVFVAKNGSVVSTDVEDFDTAAYKQDDLQSYVDKSIDDYNKKNDGSVKLKKLTVEKKKASLTMSYESVTESTEAVKTDATEGTENGADGSVSDDDILNSVKQDNEVTFDFDSEEDNSAPVSYITYVIYK